jgi:Erv1 / Alr family
MKKTKRNIKNTITKKHRIFKKNDFYSGDGFLTTIWGPTQWHMLHTISFNYPVNPTSEQKQQYRNYVLSLQNVLPCGACRKNLTNNLKKLPLTMKHMKSRDTFSRYIYNLHETVNKMLNKKSNLSYCDVRERYEHFRARCTDPKPKVFTASQIRKSTKNKTKKEKGCTEPLYGKKARCILNIVPQEEKGQSIQIDKKCIKTKE